MNQRGQYGNQWSRELVPDPWGARLGEAPPEKSTSPVVVALIAGGVGYMLHALWSVANKKRTIYKWTAP